MNDQEPLCVGPEPGARVLFQGLATKCVTVAKRFAGFYEPSHISKEVDMEAME